MNIFIDSNILFKDYFFDTKHPRKILDYTEKELVNLYMSEIVKLELRRQFKKEIENKNRELKKIIKDSSRLMLEGNIELLNVEIQLEKFDEFYNDLESLENFLLIPYKNEYLPDIVDRAIYRHKPFSENKTELKDAIIWKSYAEFVEEHELTDCILLTNNVSDFCDKDDKSKIHRDLLRDTNRFYVINSSFEFVKQKSQILESTERAFQIYINQIAKDIDEDFVLKLIKENFIKDITDKAHEYIEHLSPNEVLDNDFLFDGYVTGHGVELFECYDIEYETLTDSALIIGKIDISVESECYQYNASRDHGEEHYIFLAEEYLAFEIYFNFDLEIDENCSSFEITDIHFTGTEE